MDAKSFKEFRSQEWNIGVVSHFIYALVPLDHQARVLCKLILCLNLFSQPMPYSNYEKQKDSVLVIIQHPR